MSRETLLFAPVVLALLAGCTTAVDGPMTLVEHGFTVPDTPTLAASDLDWPDFSGRTLEILDHGAFAAFDTAASQFHDLTGATVVHDEADDAGTALNRALLDNGAPQHDILYGVDNALLWKGVVENVFEAYVPQAGHRIDPAYMFFTPGDAWPATPVDHGVIAVNIDARQAPFNETPLDGLDDLVMHADRFVTQDPRTSTPGLGYLITTIGVYGEDDTDGNGRADWQDHWIALFDGGVRITSGWTEAYETHFTGGYGVWTEGHIGDRPIVTSYSESPAYEAYFGATEVADVLLTHYGGPATFHQVQTMAILRGTPDLDLAQAWIEYTLTDDFQALAAPENAVYPVVSSVDADSVYADVDPEPGTFESVDLDWRVIGYNLERWLEEWTDLCESHDCI